MEEPLGSMSAKHFIEVVLPFQITMLPICSTILTVTTNQA